MGRESTDLTGPCVGELEWPRGRVLEQTDSPLSPLPLWPHPPPDSPRHHSPHCPHGHSPTHTTCIRLHGRMITGNQNSAIGVYRHMWYIHSFVIHQMRKIHIFPIDSHQTVLFISVCRQHHSPFYSQIKQRVFLVNEASPSTRVIWGFSYCTAAHNYSIYVIQNTCENAWKN